MAHSKANPLVFALEVESEGRRSRYVLRAGLNRVGRDAVNEIMIESEDVSRRHAELVVQDGQVIVRDLGSTNGTFVNGLKITRKSIQPGTSLCFGSTLAFLVEVDEEDARAGLLVAEDTSPGDPRYQPQNIPAAYTTDDRDEVVPAIWLRALRLFSAPHGGDANLGPRLESLRTALGARAVLVVQAGEPEEAEILATAGEVLSADAIEEAIGEVREGLAAGTSMAGWTLVGESTGNYTVAGWEVSAGKLRLLVALESSSKPRAAGALLEECAISLDEALTPTTGLAMVTTPTHSTLSFPDGYVRCRSATMLRLYAELERLLAGGLPLLITGETGVGKEAIARAVHLSSTRRDGPFIAVNCAAIPTELLETELFGIEARVATGVTARPGKMIQANGGVLFLDEIGEMPVELQPKLLRTLEEKEVVPIGGCEPLPVDLRIVSATNAPIEAHLASGGIRRDLYYRLAGATIAVPPLRERPGDIPLLVQHFIEQAAHELGKRIPGVSLRTLRALMAAEWPGNVRQLEHEVRRMVHLCPNGQLLGTELLSPHFQPIAERRERNAPGSGLEIEPRLRALERDLIAQALTRTGGNRTQAAKLLGVSRYGLSLKIKRLGLEDWILPGGRSLQNSPER